MTSKVDPRAVRVKPVLLQHINPFSAGTVSIRQILMYKDDPRTERLKHLIRNKKQDVREGEITT